MPASKTEWQKLYRVYLHSPEPQKWLCKLFIQVPRTLLGMRTRIFCLAPASQYVNSPTEAARARALLTAREARLSYESARTAEARLLTNDGS